jgi:hypothetical protein
MATVAALALAVPAMAQDQTQPLDTEQDSLQQMQDTLQEQQGDAAAQGEQATEPPVTATEPMTEEPAAQDLAEDPEAAPPADMTFIEVQEAAQFLAEQEVIGGDVVNIMDESVGTIADLVMNEDQKLVGVVLSVGGFLGIGEKWVAVPVEQIDFPTGDQPARLLAAVTKEQLENAPDFVTRDVVEAEQAAAEAQQQMQQVPPPATTTQ